MSMEIFDNYNFEEITLKNNKDLYHKYLKEMCNNRLAKKIVQEMYGQSLPSIYQKIIEEEANHRSLDFFPGDLVILYDGIKYSSAKKFITCYFSGAKISPKSKYIIYRPLLDNISKNESYVLKRTIKVESGYESALPQNIYELETLQRNINLQNNYENDGIDYSHLTNQIGEDLIFQKLKRKGKFL